MVVRLTLDQVVSVRFRVGLFFLAGCSCEVSLGALCSRFLWGSAMQAKIERVLASDLSDTEKAEVIRLLLSGEAPSVGEISGFTQSSKKKSKKKSSKKLRPSQVKWRARAMEAHSSECAEIVAAVVEELEDGEAVLVSNRASSGDSYDEMLRIFSEEDGVPHPQEDCGWKGSSCPTPFAFCLRESLKAADVTVRAWVPSMVE